MVNRRLFSVTGKARKLDGGALFGTTPRSVWCDWMSPDHDNQVELASRALLVQQNGQNILLMAGAEGLLAPLAPSCRCQRPAFGLLDSLARLGIAEEQIHGVVLSHLHAVLSPQVRRAVNDGETPRLLFPKARYLIGRQHWGRATRPHPRDRALFVPQIVNRLLGSERVVLLDEQPNALLGQGWRFHVSDGYTPGQLLAEIEMPGGPVIFAGDLVPGQPWLALDLTTAYDRNPESLIDEKERMLDHLIASGGRLFLPRDREVASIKVLRDRYSRYQSYDHQAVLHCQEH